MKGVLSTCAKETQEDLEARRQQRKAVRLIKVAGKTGTDLHMVAKVASQDGIGWNKILGRPYHSVANRSRKLNWIHSNTMKRQLSISTHTRLRGGLRFSHSKFWSVSEEIQELQKALNTINSRIWEKADNFSKQSRHRKVQQAGRCVISWKC